MKLLHRVMKQPGEAEEIQPFDFFAGFQIERTESEEEEDDSEEEEQEVLPPQPSVSSEELLEQAKIQVEKLLADAREQAEILREEAFAEGREQGIEEGRKQAYAEHKAELTEEIKILQRNAADLIQSVSHEKTRILEKYADDLKRIALSVAEKIVHTSLQASGDVVKRMILAATDKMTKRQWAKIYITKCNTGIALDVDAEFLDMLSHLSDNIKIVAMENEEEGTCIIELPDEIIDASVGTQLENIKDIINNVRG